LHFVGPRNDAPYSPVLRAAAPAKHLLGQPPADGPGLTWVRFHDLRRFAATMFACTGASTK